jgi:hypothetical protein
MSIKTTITNNNLESATIGDKTFTRRTEGGQVIYDGASGGGGGAEGGGGVPVKGISTAGGGFGLPGELTGIRIEYSALASNNSTDGSITIQYNDSGGTARAFKLIGNGVGGVTAGSAGDTSN